MDTVIIVNQAYTFAHKVCVYLLYSSLSTVVFNSRDQPKIYGFQKECTYINIDIKIRIWKTYLNATVLLNCNIALAR